MGERKMSSVKKTIEKSNVTRTKKQNEKKKDRTAAWLPVERRISSTLIRQPSNVARITQACLRHQTRLHTQKGYREKMSAMAMLRPFVRSFKLAHMDAREFAALASSVSRTSRTSRARTGDSIWRSSTWAQRRNAVEAFLRTARHDVHRRMSSTGRVYTTPSRALSTTPSDHRTMRNEPSGSNRNDSEATRPLHVCHGGDNDDDGDVAHDNDDDYNDDDDDDDDDDGDDDDNDDDDDDDDDDMPRDVECDARHGEGNDDENDAAVLDDNETPGMYTSRLNELCAKVGMKVPTADFLNIGSIHEPRWQATYMDTSGRREWAEGKTKRVANNLLSKKLLQWEKYKYSTESCQVSDESMSLSDIYVRHANGRARVTVVLETRDVLEMVSLASNATWLALDCEGTEESPPISIQLHVPEEDTKKSGTMDTAGGLHRGGREFVIFPRLYRDAWQAVKELLKDKRVLKVLFAMDNDVASMHHIPTPVFDVRAYAEKYGLHRGIGLTRMYEHVTKSRMSVLPKEKYRKIPVWTTRREIDDAVVVYAASDAWATAAIFDQFLSDQVYVLPGPGEKAVESPLPNRVLQKIQDTILTF